MQSLYRRRGDLLHYRQIWLEGRFICERYGTSGERGLSHKAPLARGARAPDVFQKHLRLAQADGYRFFGDGEHVRLAIEYLIDDDTADMMLRRRHALEQRLHETLSWTGLGHCGGGGTGAGAGTMEVQCWVVDFDVARRVVETDLHGTLFCDYARIFRPGS